MDSDYRRARKPVGQLDAELSLVEGDATMNLSIRPNIDSPTTALRCGDKRTSPTLHRRAGVTFIELLVVLTFLSLMWMMTYKSVLSSYSGNARQSATRELASYVFQARASSVRRSRQTWVIRQGNTVKILVDSSGSKVPLGTILDLSARHGVTLTSNRDTIAFDSRGFVTLVSPATMVVVNKGTKADTVCVTGIGNTKSRACS
jgi:type II secretory pathway pseudopilin PulG